jgi:beta-galactosidase GanA
MLLVDYFPTSREKNSLKFSDGMSLPVHVFAELLVPKSAKVLATWERDYLQGIPSVTENKYGQGRAVY